MQFSENSRVWIYQADREFISAELQQLQQLLNQFTDTWTAHNQELKAKAEIYYQRFIILIVDETHARASGCSIDKSVRLMQEIEQQFGVNLFDRFNIAYREGEQVLTANREKFETLIQRGYINADTIVFNNLISSLIDLNTKWEVPLKDSWHVRVFGSFVKV